MPELAGLGQVAIHVSDVPSAVDFYRDVFGLRFLFSAGANLAFFDLWGVRLMIETAIQGKVGNNSVLYFRCPDLDAAYEDIRVKVETVGAPHLTLDNFPSKSGQVNRSCWSPSETITKRKQIFGPHSA